MISEGHSARSLVMQVKMSKLQCMQCVGELVEIIHQTYHEEWFQPSNEAEARKSERRYHSRAFLAVLVPWTVLAGNGETARQHGKETTTEKTQACIKNGSGMRR